MSTHPQPNHRRLALLVAALAVLGLAPAPTGGSSPPGGETGCRDIINVAAELTRETYDHEDHAILLGADLDEDDDTVTVTHTFSATVVLDKAACSDVDYLIDVYDGAEDDEDVPPIATVTGTATDDRTRVAFGWSRTTHDVEVSETDWCVQFVARTGNDEGKVFDHSPDEDEDRAAVCSDPSSPGTGSHG